MKSDIENRDDVVLLVNSFYKSVQEDRLLGPYFTEVGKVDWDTHLKTMYDFWENIIFNAGTYKGNTLKVHENLNQLSKISQNHFKKWLELFEQTTNELFTGTNAQNAVNRASSIATVMQIKLKSY